MAAGRRNPRKAEVESTTETPVETEPTVKPTKAKGGKKAKPAAEAENVEMDEPVEQTKPEPKKKAKAAAPKKAQPKAKRGASPPAEAAEDAEMEEDEDATEEPAPKKNAKAAKKADSKKEVTKKEAPKKTTNKKEAAPKKPVAKKETAPKKEAGTKKTVTKKASTAVSEEVEEEDEPVEAQPKKTAKAAAPKKVVAKAEDPTRGVKRARTIKDDVNAAKRAKLDESRFVLRGPHIEGVINQGGTVLCVGQGDTGQIGLGPDVMEASKPKVVSSINGSPVVSICAGGMHSLALTKEGVVYSFGCNDDGALGRITEDDDETYTPAEVKLDVKIIQICAGDSHSAALTSDGKVFYWGTFRDNSGSFGLTPNGNQPSPIPLAHHLKVRKIVSGENHIVMLTEEGQLYTVGCAEQGRLGRIAELFVGRGGRRGLALPLSADLVHTKNKRVAFADVWAGSMSTVALTTDNEVLVCGLNNYSQLGIEKKTEIFFLTKSPAFTKIAQENGLSQVVFGQHHVMLLDSAGKVYSLGRHDYGVLGLGEDVTSEVHVPTQIKGELETQPCVEIACGTSVSYAVTASGHAYSWGMGTNLQLAHSGDDDALVPTKMIGQQMNDKKVVGISSGGQHTILLAQP